MGDALNKCCLVALRRMNRDQCLRSYDWDGCCEIMAPQGLCEWSPSREGYVITAAGRLAVTRVQATANGRAIIRCRFREGGG